MNKTLEDIIHTLGTVNFSSHNQMREAIEGALSIAESYQQSLPAAKPASGAYVSAKTSWPNKRGSFVIRYQNGRTDSWFIDQPNDTAKETWFKAANNCLFEWWDENAIAEAPVKPVSEDAAVTEQEMSSLRWLLNVSSEKPKTQLFTALDNCCDKEGISHRTHLENLWNKIKSGYAAATECKKCKETEYLITNEPTNFLLVNALRLLDSDGMKALADSLYERVPAAPQKGMKWVKASERLPEIWKCHGSASEKVPIKLYGEFFHVGRIVKNGGRIKFEILDGKNPTDFESESFHLIEWLDESPSPSEEGMK